MKNQPMDLDQSKNTHGLNWFTHTNKNGYKYSFKSANIYTAVLFAMWKFTDVGSIVLDTE